MEEEEEIVGSDFVGSDDEDKSVEALELKLKTILEEKEQLERKRKREELLAKIKLAKAEVSNLHAAAQPTQQEIDKWTEDELRDFFKTKGITIKNKSLHHLQTLAKSVSEAKIPDFEVTVPPTVDRRTVKLNGNSHTFPHITESSISNWSEELSSLPSIDHVVAHAYILLSADFDLERFKNLRQEEAYSLFKGSSVRNVKMHDLDGGYSYLKACCCSSSNDVNNSEDVWILIQDDGIIQSAGCSCTGDTGCCKHVVALLLTVASFNKSNTPIHNVCTTKIEERLSKAACSPESSSIKHDLLKTHQNTKAGIKTNRDIVQSRRLVCENDNSDDSEDEPEIWIPPEVKSSVRNEEGSTHKIHLHLQAKDTNTDDIFIPSTSIRGITTVEKTSAKPNTSGEESSHSIHQVQPKPFPGMKNLTQDTNKIAFKQTGRTQNTTKCQTFEEQDSELNTNIRQNLKELKMSSASTPAHKQETPSKRTTDNSVLVNTYVQPTIRPFTSDTIPLLQSSTIRSESFISVKTTQPEVSSNMKQTGPAIQQEQGNKISASLLSNIEPLKYPNASPNPTNSNSFSALYQQMKYPSSSEKIDCYSSNDRSISGIPVTMQNYHENASIGKPPVSSGMVYPRLVYPSLGTTDISQKTTQSSSVMSPTMQVYSGNTPLVKPFPSPGISYLDNSQYPASRPEYPEVATGQICQKTAASSSRMPMTTHNSSKHNSIETPFDSCGMAYAVNSRSQASRLESSPVVERELSQKTVQPNPLVNPFASPGTVYQGTIQSPATHLVYPEVTTREFGQKTTTPFSGTAMSTRTSSKINSVESPFDNCGMAYPVNSRSQASRLEYSPVVKSEFSQKTAQSNPGMPATAHICTEKKPVAEPFTSCGMAYPDNSQATASRLVYPSMDTSEISQSAPRSSSRMRVAMHSNNTVVTPSGISKDSYASASYDQSRVGFDQLDLQDEVQMLLKKEPHPDVIKFQQDNFDNACVLESSDIYRGFSKSKVNRRDRFKLSVQSSPPMTTKEAIPQKTITYDRTFLLKLRKSVFAKRKPDISHLPEIMVEYEDTKTTNTPLSSNLDVGYIRGVSKKAMKCKKPRQDRSNSPKPVRYPVSADDIQRPSHQSYSPKPRHGQFDIKAEGLQMVDVPQKTDVVGYIVQDKMSTEEIMRKAIGAFNMLKNGCDSSVVVDTISSLTISTENCLSRIVSLLVETVIDEPGLTSVCSSICRVLARAKVPSSDGVLTFSMAYRQKCENEIELGIFSRSAESYQRRIEELTRFTTSICRLVLLKTHDIHLILMKLYTTGSEHCLLCFCTLLVDVWDRMEKCTSQNFIDQYSDIIEEIQSTDPTEALKYKISQLNRRRGKYKL